MSKSRLSTSVTGTICMCVLLIVDISNMLLQNLKALLSLFADTSRATIRFIFHSKLDANSIV